MIFWTRFKILNFVIETLDIPMQPKHLSCCWVTVVLRKQTPHRLYNFHIAEPLSLQASASPSSLGGWREAQTIRPPIRRMSEGVLNKACPKPFPTLPYQPSHIPPRSPFRPSPSPCFFQLSVNCLRGYYLKGVLRNSIVSLFPVCVTNFKIASQ